MYCSFEGHWNWRLMEMPSLSVRIWNVKYHSKSMEPVTMPSPMVIVISILDSEIIPSISSWQSVWTTDYE